MLAELLGRARELNRDRSYPELVTLLGDQPEENLFEEPELALLYADVLRRVGRSDETLTVCTKLEPFCRRRGNDRLCRGRLNVMGMAQFDQGLVEQAELSWTELDERARQAADEEYSAKASHNLGVILTLTDRMEEALSTYSRALASYQRLGHRRGLGQTHHNLGISYRELGFLPEADEHFRKALEFARSDRSEDEIARVEQERALIYVLSGDAAMARNSANRALDRYTRLEDPTGQGEAWRTIGLIQLAAGESEDSLSSMNRALDLALASRAALLEAEILAALAFLHRSAGRPLEADEYQEAARDRFRDLGAEAWGEKEFRRLDRFSSANRDEPGNGEQGSQR